MLGPTFRICAHCYLVLAELATVVRRFSQTGIQDFLTLTLTEQTGLLYVGAREALFAFSVEALELQGVVRGGEREVHRRMTDCPHPTSSGGSCWVCKACPLGRASGQPFLCPQHLVRSTDWEPFGACVLC